MRKDEEQRVDEGFPSLKLVRSDLRQRSRLSKVPCS